MSLEIRTFQTGDEAAQAAIYNVAAATFPGFKPATSEDVRRRTRDKDFDGRLRVYAVEHGEIVGYCAAQSNGRIGYPWCSAGKNIQEPLLNAALKACKAHGIKRLFTAYRADWAEPIAFFESQGFKKTRDMVNFSQNLLDLPTMVVRRGLNVSPLQEADLPAMAEFAPQVVRMPADQLKSWYLHNPYYPSESLFVLRKANGTPQGFGLLISNPDYADPHNIDSSAPCFRLGAFGTEAMTTKRVNGLFSFLVRDDSDANAIGLDLLSYALHRLEDDTIELLAAQAPSDARHLAGFYQKYFRKQGSFPIYERELN